MKNFVFQKLLKFRLFHRLLIKSYLDFVECLMINLQKRSNIINFERLELIRE